MPDDAPGWSGGQRAFGDFAPGLVHYTDQVLFDEVWERPELSNRDRSLATVAALIAGGDIEQLNFHSRSPGRTPSPRRSSSKPSPTSPSTPAGPRPCLR